MGMYGSIGKDEFKFGGILAEACRRAGLVVEDGGILIPADKFARILTEMAFLFKKGGYGDTMSDDGLNVEGYKVYSLAANARLYASFFDFVVGRNRTEEDPQGAEDIYFG